MSNHFWDNAISKDGDKETTKEEKLEFHQFYLKKASMPTSINIMSK